MCTHLARRRASTGSWVVAIRTSYTRAIKFNFACSVAWATTTQCSVPYLLLGSYYLGTESGGVGSHMGLNDCAGIEYTIAQTE